MAAGLRIRDREVRALATISATLEIEYTSAREDAWAGSPFAWIRAQSSRRRGKIGEQLLSALLAARDFTVGPARSSHADRIVNGKLVEVKFSTLWEAGTYTFQQIRDQRYDVMVCLGVSPFDAHCWVMTKQILRRHVIGKMGQHSGERASETAWITIAPSEPFRWMRSCGGTLRDALTLLRRLAPPQA